MFGKLIILFAILAFAFARPQVFPAYEYNYGTYSGAISPGYYGYPGNSNPYPYGSYGTNAASPYSSLNYGYY